MREQVDMPTTFQALFSEALAKARELAEKQERLIRLKALLNGRSPRISDIPRAGKTADWTDVAIKAIDLEREVDADIQALNANRSEIEAIIMRVPDPKARMVLVYRYLRGLSWREISAIMRCDRTTIWRLHSKAIAMAEQAMRE